MSYYQRSSFSVSNHAISRAKQRVNNWKTLDDFQIRVNIINLLNKSYSPEFSDKNYDYYHLYDEFNKYLYIIVKRNSGLVVSITPISHHKKIHIFS